MRLNNPKPQPMYGYYNLGRLLGVKNTRREAIKDVESLCGGPRSRCKEYMEVRKVIVAPIATTTQPGAEALRELVRRAIPFLRDEGANYADDGSNEPLELAREMESLLARGG